MATIEPRLIHLLNNTQTPDLPPIQLLPFDAAVDESLSLPPLEPDAQRADKSASTAQTTQAPQIPPLHAVGDDSFSVKQVTRTNNAFTNDTPSRLTNKSSLQLLLRDSAGVNTSTLPLRIFDDNTTDPSEDPSTKKRHRALTTKDDFVQLPQPLKKQKSTQQVVPPIIAGLHEPPPNAAVFPPISSGTFDNPEALSNLNLLKDFGNAGALSGDDRTAAAAATSAGEGDKYNGGNSAKVKRRAAKPRRKWSDEETNHLLLGVSRHGVGKWTSILEDPDFKFNERTAGDLKDRFRTCCPDELRGSTGKKRPGKDRTDHGPSPYGNTSDDNNSFIGGGGGGGSSSSQKHGGHGLLLLENILIDPEGPPTPVLSSRDRDTLPSSQQQHPDSDPQNQQQQRKSRAHRKRLEDLVELGIHGPFKKSHRRERRPFTEQDDKEILEGLDRYGPAWTKIQRDRRYNLSSRQPTDLRDRVRNKYPEIYARIEKGSFHDKDGAIGGAGRGGVLEPLVSMNTTIEKLKALHHPSGTGGVTSLEAQQQQQQLNRSNSREEMPKWIPTSAFYESSTESLPGTLPGFADVLLDLGALGGGGNEPSSSASGTTMMGTGSGGSGPGMFVGATDMDISRLLLDDGNVERHPQQQQQHHHQRYGSGGGGGYEDGRYGMGGR
ncbi:MYB DNA-binding domain-containing protein [Lasiosphaeria hispida]|uniref:MYB DNA-binding domain-containing protein n=1 Tax=Lasiosphaeria hispida TaxID=260671 RepID=A0AAJ0HVR9_9PEZI|nr:MYB DNA-binding domain-containing protein [Lasiosphaeria hispida]